MGSYQCDRCLKRFSSYYNVRRHKANHCPYAHSFDENSVLEYEDKPYCTDDEIPRKKFRYTESDEDVSTSSRDDESTENAEESSENVEERSENDEERSENVEESVTETEDDENCKNSEDDGEMQEEIDPWATMIDDAKVTVGPEYDELLKTLQMDGQEDSVAKQKVFEKILPELQKEFADVYLDNLRWIKALKKDPVHRNIMETKETFMNEDSFDPDEALSAAVDKRKYLLKRLLEDQGRFSESDDDQ